MQQKNDRKELNGLNEMLAASFSKAKFLEEKKNEKLKKKKKEGKETN